MSAEGAGSIVKAHGSINGEVTMVRSKLEWKAVSSYS